MEESKFSLNPAIAIVVAGAFIAAAILYTHTHPAPVAVADVNSLPATVAVSAPRQDEHIVGSSTAPIVLIEYSDFQCPYCSLVYPTIKRIVSEGNGQVAWIMRNYPLESIHPQARPGAQAAECITKQLGNTAFWRFADIIFGNQNAISPAYYKQTALLLGANGATYDACLNSQAVADTIDNESAEATINGGQGTPYTVIYGKDGTQVAVSGAVPYAQFKAVINQVLTRQK